MPAEIQHGARRVVSPHFLARRASMKGLLRRGVVCGAAITATFISVVSAVKAAPIFSSVHNEEVQRRSTGTPEYVVGQAQPTTGLRVGYQSGFQPTTAKPGGIAALYYFPLPALPDGQEVSTATFAVSELKASAGVLPTFNIDLYAVGYETGNPFGTDSPSSGYGTGGVASTTVAQTYFFTGANQTGATGAGGFAMQRIADDLFVGSDFTAANAAGSVAKTTTAAAGSPLALYIQSIYNANPTGGGYLILRLTPDALTDTNLGTMRYQFPLVPDSDPGAGTGPTYDSTFGTVTLPQIDLTFVPVPEPSGLALAGVAAVGLLRRRGRKL
jgi:hypothetical protein